MNASCEELLSEIRILRSEVASLKVENARLRDENAHLKEQLKLNSKNSSKPPSTDQKATNEIPKKKGGARPGHPGHFRPLFSASQVDAFVNLEAKSCPTCGEAVRPSDEPPSIHQQVEIALKPYTVTQYNRGSFYCPCCRKYGAAPLPSPIGSSAFGTRLSAFMGFLTGTCRLSRRIALDILKEGLGLRAAVGTRRDALLGNAVTKRVCFVTDRLAIDRFQGPHQYCLAHLKRDIKRFAERAGLDGEWGQVMLQYLQRIFELWRDYREKRRTRRSFRRSSRQCRDDFEYGLLVASAGDTVLLSSGSLALCCARRKICGFLPLGMGWIQRTIRLKGICEASSLREESATGLRANVAIVLLRESIAL